MDLGKVMEGGPTSHGLPSSDLEHPVTSTSTMNRPEISRTSDMTSHIDDAARSPADVWAGAISRMQTQVSYNTSMLESHRRQVGDIEQAVGRLHADMGNVVAALNEVRGELRARPTVLEQARHDPGDLDLLATQVAIVTNKANEVDGLKMQLELLRNRIRRYEEHSSPSAHLQRPGTSSTHREIYEAPPAQLTHQHPMPQQPLPPMRTASLSSQSNEHQSGMHAPPAPFSQGIANYQPSVAGTAYARSSNAGLESSVSSFRPSEPPPSQSSYSGWRPAEPYGSSAFQPAQLASQPHQPEASGWAAVNASQSIKRPFEKQEFPSAPGSPKRPRLAPIMPRGTYGDENIASAAPSMRRLAPTNTLDGSSQHVNYPPSDPSQIQPQGLPTLASANTNAYRFITSTAQADSQTSWRPEHERMQPVQHPEPVVPPTRGKGRGRGRGKGNRGVEVLTHDHHQDVEVVGTPDDWTGSQISPGGYYNPTQAHRGSVARRSGGTAGGPSEREHDYPSTPVHTENDLFAAQLDEANASANKKSRTKPIRNAEGVLIRKDGRPDMRSVSSANNLRRVHQKKEAERAEMGGRTPTSARSLAPAQSRSLSEEDQEGSRSGTPNSAFAAEGRAQDTQGRHQELMSKIFPHGMEDGVDHRNYFARPEEQSTTTPGARTVKTERNDDEGREGAEDVAEHNETADTVMRETSESQGADSTAAHQQSQQQDSHNASMEPKREQSGTAV